MKSASFISICLFFSIITRANNVALSNVTVINNVTNTGKIIQFDLTWENSWRTASTGNWDGVWVFFKFKDNDGNWKHLNFTGTNITMPVGATYDMGNNGAVIGVGMFIYRAALGSGTAIATNIKAGIQSYPGTFEVRGFAIEMVYIPQGSFYLGDSSTSSGIYRRANTSLSPYLVSSNGAGIIMGTTGTNLKDIYANGYTGSLSGFPSGYSSFWIMKYELSRGAFRDFLNTLNYNQQTNLFYFTTPPSSPTGTAITSNVGGASNQIQRLEIAVPGVANTTAAVVGVDMDDDNLYNEANDGEWKPVLYINWIHAAAYLDWAGLRPMTELELEKAARGPLYPEPFEFAWGTAEADTNSYIFSGIGTAAEAVTNASSTAGNMIYNVTSLAATGGPLLRGGGFANAFSTRISSGAGYYGAMEISGSLNELCVSTSSTMGRSYTGKHGDGLLSTTGYANENYWPGINGSIDTSQVSGVYNGGAGVRSNAGIIERCGSCTGGDIYAKLSYRFSPSILLQLLGNMNIANFSQGIRGVRDAN